MVGRLGELSCVAADEISAYVEPRRAMESVSFSWLGKFGDECKYKHPRTNGKCLRCGAEGHSLSSCTRPSKTKSGSQSKQSTKGKGRSSQTTPSVKPSPDAKAKAQPKKDGAKGKGKGKKDKSSTKTSTKPSNTSSNKSSAKSSTKTSAKSGEVSFDNEDAEDEDPDAEHPWGDEEEEQVEEEQLEQDMADDHAFATPYHSHVGEVYDFEGDAVQTVHSLDSDGQVTLEEYGTMDPDMVNEPGGTCTSDSSVPHQSRSFPSEPARLAAEAVMQTTFPAMIAGMNPDWEPLTAEDLLHDSDRSSESMDLLTSEEEPDEEEYYTNSEEGYPDIQRVLTYPARLTDDGGVERIGPVEVLSEADPNWNQWDQDQWFAYRSDSDYKGRTCAYTAASSSIPASAKDSWEWRGSCCLVRVHRHLVDVYLPRHGRKISGKVSRYSPRERLM